MTDSKTSNLPIGFWLKKVDQLCLGPEAARAHPREEHYLPLLVALGAGGDGPGVTLHRGFEHGALSMAAFSFG
jgi:4,5-DOPA dioxygenase extradiol